MDDYKKVIQQLQQLADESSGELREKIYEEMRNLKNEK